MRLQEKVKLEDKEVVVKELTVGEIRQGLMRLEKQEEPGMLDMLMEDLPEVFFLLATDLSSEELDKLTQSEIKKIKEVIEKINPFLHKTLKRLAEAGRKMLEKT